MKDNTTTQNLLRIVCKRGSEAGELVARLCYWVARQPAQQPPQLILNQGGQPIAPASVNKD